MATLDGERLEEWLTQMQASLVIGRDERFAAEGSDDPTGIRMDGGVTNITVILGQLRNFAVGSKKTPMASIEVETRDLVRTHARGTSWDAALSITPKGRQRMYQAIYRLLSALGPMTDHEIRDAMEIRNFAHSWSGLSARRVELERAGWVRDTGEKRMTQFGKTATVWEAVQEES